MSDRKRTSIEYSEEDLRFLERVRERYGLSSDVEAVRLSLRIADQVNFLQLQNQGHYAEGSQQRNG